MKDSFLKILQTQGKKPYFEIILNHLAQGNKENKLIFPHQTEMFRAFEFFQVHETKLIILGQDPYSEFGVADGLAFSTHNLKTPPSLNNIFKEIKKDYPNASFKANSLVPWAKQNILLLNASLTVLENKPNSHKNIGWQNFAAAVIHEVVRINKNVIILALGNYAHKVVDNALYLVNFDSKNLFKLSHPSPLGYHHSFKDSHVFKKINDRLEQLNLEQINWNL